MTPATFILVETRFEFKILENSVTTSPSLLSLTTRQPLKHSNALTISVKPGKRHSSLLRRLAMPASLLSIFVRKRVMHFFVVFATLMADFIITKECFQSFVLHSCRFGFGGLYPERNISSINSRVVPTTDKAYDG